MFPKGNAFSHMKPPLSEGWLKGVVAGSLKFLFVLHISQIWLQISVTYCKG